MILGQMKYYIEGQREIVLLVKGGDIASVDECLRHVAVENSTASLDGFMRYINPDVTWIFGELQLPSIAAAKFDDGRYAMLANETIQKFRLEPGETAGGAATRITSENIAAFPICR